MMPLLWKWKCRLIADSYYIYKECRHICWYFFYIDILYLCDYNFVQSHIVSVMSHFMDGVNCMDNRSYGRYRISGVDACLYAPQITDEANGLVHDISEEGVGIFIPSSELTKVDLNLGDVLTFVFCDDVNLSKSFNKSVVVADCIVKHIDDYSDGILVGGRVSNEDYRQYCLNKELILHHRMLQKCAV